MNPYCQVFFHLWQYPISFCLWSLQITTHTLCRVRRNYFYITLDFLQLGFWKRIMLLQDCCYHYRSFIVIMDSWVVTVNSSAPWKLICSMCQLSFSNSSTIDYNILHQIACARRRKPHSYWRNSSRNIKQNKLAKRDYC